MSDPLAAIPLSAIRVFEAAARAGSFTRAAAELGMTQAAVSWQVKALEKRLGQPLFVRLPREVALTTAGERLARAASEAMASLRSAVADITEEGDAVLAVTTLHTFASRWLAGRLGSFQLAHPQIAVRLDSDGRLRDLLRGEADLAIRWSRRQDWPGLEAILLFPTAETALVTPEALALLGPEPKPQDLVAAPRIGLEAEWAEWFAAAGVEAAPAGPAAPRLAADTQALEVSAAMASGGVALGSPVMFAAEIAAGRLHQPFEVYIAEDTGYWLLTRKTVAGTRKVAAFRDWLLAEIAADASAQKMRRRIAPAGR